MHGVTSDALIPRAQRYALARRVCNVFVTSSSPFKRQFIALMRSLAEQHTTMIIVTHEMAFARDVADKVVFMDGGVIVEQGDPKEVFGNPKEERTKQFLARYKQG